MKKLFITLCAFITLFSMTVPVHADNNFQVSGSHVREVRNMSEEEIQEKLDHIDLKYSYNERFSNEDADFILALREIENEDSKLISPYALPAARQLNFNVGPAKGFILYIWYDFSRTLLTTGYAGRFNTTFDYQSRQQVKLYTISISFQAYGVVGQDGIGKIKDFSDYSNFSITPNVAIYGTTFDTWSYSPVLWTNTKLNLKFTDSSKTYTTSFSISVKNN